MSKTKQEYNKAANIWILSRSADNYKDMDPKLLKQNRPHFFVEKPAMNSKVGDLTGKKVLALGCGSGEEVEMLKAHGATDIVGIDISEELINHARKNHPDCKFEVMSADKMIFDENQFDFIFSSLVMHYFKDWAEVTKEIFRVLSSNGLFLFSTLHPVKWSAEKLNDEDGKAYATYMGFENSTENSDQKIYGDYLNTVKLTETWMKSLTVVMYPRSLGSMFRSLVGVGFEIKDIYEPKAIEETKDYDMEYYLVNQKIPNFIIFECEKK